jgi:hypothetical protein
MDRLWAARVRLRSRHHFVEHTQQVEVERSKASHPSIITVNENNTKHPLEIYVAMPQIEGVDVGWIAAIHARSN